MYRTFVQRILENAGYLVLAFEDGRTALEALDKYQPKCIISDIQMPRMNGFELHRMVNRYFPHRGISFIYMTSNPSTKNIEKAFNLGAVDFFGKPMQKSELLRRIAISVKPANS